MKLDSRNNSPSLAVGIPTLNRSVDLERLLCCILENSVHPDEIVICDQSDNGQTEECIRRYATRIQDTRFVYLHSTRKSAVHARNLIFEKSTCDYLVLLDDDALIPPDLFAVLRSRINPEIHVLNLRKIESRDFGVTYNSYEQFRNDIGRVAEYEHRMTFAGSIVNLAYMLTLNSHRRKGKLRLNRLMRVVHDYDSKTDKCGEVICGLVVLSREVYKNYRFDYAMGEGYTLLEDNEFSAQISPKYVVHAFGNLWAYHNKDLSDANRLPNQEIIRRHYKNSLHIFKKHADTGLFNRILFMYSRVGFCLINNTLSVLSGGPNLMCAHLYGLIETARGLFSSAD